jgi:hypothetical protein
MTIIFDVAGMDELTGGRLATLDLRDTVIVIRVPQPEASGRPVLTIPVTPVFAGAFDEEEPTWEDAEWQ